MSDFRTTLTAAGLRPLDVVADGKRRRCATDDKPHRKNGQYVLLLDGVTGFWRNFAESTEWNVWKDGNATKAKPVDPAIIAAQRAKAREDRRRAMQFIAKLWGEAKRFTGHPYITDKGLNPQGCAGLRVWRGGVWVDEGKVFDDWLLVPMYWQGRMVNIQRISSTGIKRQIANAPQVGATFELARSHCAVTVLCEGFATGLAVYQAVRHAKVVVCFFVDNLLPVLQELRPTGSVVLAADNDHGTAARGKGNPGIEKAKNAASLIDAGVAWPEGIEGTDWADAAKEWGQFAGKRIEREILAGARYVVGSV